MRAIETKWKGWRFRSRTEARWAVFLEAIGLRFEYEPVGALLPSGPYLPDFKFETYNQIKMIGGEIKEYTETYWLEIKGETPTEAEQKRCWELAEASKSTVLLAVGAPDVRGQIYRFSGAIEFDWERYFQKFDGLAYFAVCDQRGGLCLAYPDGRPVIDRDTGEAYAAKTQLYIGQPARPDVFPNVTGGWSTEVPPWMQAAYDAARSARFEFGETDKRWDE